MVGIGSPDRLLERPILGVSGMAGMGRLAASRANDDDNGVFTIVSDAKAFAASSSNPNPFIRNARIN